MKRIQVIAATTVLAVTVGIVTASSSSAAPVLSTHKNVITAIAGAIEKAAATVIQAVTPQPPSSSIAQQAYKPVTQAVCRISITYVLSYVPFLTYAYRGSMLVPITASYVVSTPVQTKVCG
jgi:hypothetical protein